MGYPKQKSDGLLRAVNVICSAERAVAKPTCSREGLKTCRHAIFETGSMFLLMIDRYLSPTPQLTRCSRLSKKHRSGVCAVNIGFCTDLWYIKPVGQSKMQMGKK